MPPGRRDRGRGDGAEGRRGVQEEHGGGGGGQAGGRSRQGKRGEEEGGQGGGGGGRVGGGGGRRSRHQVMSIASVARFFSRTPRRTLNFTKKASKALHN